MQTRISWTRLPFGDGRWLVYSPRFARTYLVPPNVANSAALPSLLGLRSTGYRQQLPDPARSVGPLDGAESGTPAGRLLPLLYVFFHRHRTVASIDRAIRLASWLARRRSRQPWGAREIGKLIRAVESSVGISDCYPRALLTAYLCMTARLNCEVTVGILAPTVNMHAWCSIGGAIPYEPDPSHWFYSPLVVVDITH